MEHIVSGLEIVESARLQKGKAYVLSNVAGVEECCHRFGVYNSFRLGSKMPKLSYLPCRWLHVGRVIICNMSL